MPDVSNTFTLNHEVSRAPGHYDLEDIIKDVYDTTNNALRIRTAKDDSACGVMLDAGQTLELVYDQSGHCLNVVVLGPSGGANTLLDWEQVIKACLDTDKAKLRIVT